MLRPFSYLGKRRQMLEGIDVEKELDVLKLRKIEEQRQAIQQYFFGDQNHPLNSNAVHQELFLQKNNSKMQQEFLMKAYSNWRLIVEEMVLTSARLQKIVEVS